MTKTAVLLVVCTLILVSCAAPAAPAASPPAAAPTEATAAMPPGAATAVPAGAATAIPVTGELPDLDGRTILIATDPIPPFIIVGDDGTLSGFEPDLMTEICRLLNCQTEWENVNYDAIFAALQAGEYDAIVTDVPYSAERAEILDFTQPYFLSGQVVVVRTDRPEIQTPEDLKEPGVIVAVQTGGEGLEIARSLGVPEDQIKQYDTVDLKYLAIDRGDAVATIDTVEIAGQFVDTYQGKLRILEDENGIIYIRQETIHIVVQKGSDLKAPFDAAIEQLIQDGTVETLLQKYNLPVSIPEI